MSGSHKPGTTFKATVVSASGSQLVIEGEAEDIAYFVAGVEYTFHVRIADPGHDGGDNDQSA